MKGSAGLILKCLCTLEEMLPLPGVLAQCKQLWIALCGTPCRHSALIGGWKWLCPDLKFCASHSSVVPYRKAVNHSCLPSFQPNSVFRVLWTNIFISDAWLSFKSPSFMDSCGTDQCCSSLGERGGFLAFLPFAGPLPQEWSLDCCSGSEFMATLSRKPVSRFAVFSQLPFQCLGTLSHSGIPAFLTIRSKYSRI